MVVCICNPLLWEVEATLSLGHQRESVHITEILQKDYSNDLMLLHLDQPAEITDYVKVLSLPTEEPKLGSRCFASGWGSIEPSECKSEPNHTA